MGGDKGQNEKEKNHFPDDEKKEKNEFWFSEPSQKRISVFFWCCLVGVVPRNACQVQTNSAVISLISVFVLGFVVIGL